MQIKTFDSFYPEHIKLYEEIFELIKPIQDFYPNYEKWYREKFIPGLKKKERLYIVAYDDKKNILSGCALLKKTREENKLCTLFVHPNYRSQGLGKKLMQQALNAFGKLPLLTISSKNFSKYQPLLKHFGFHWSASKKNVYQENDIELYFNEPKSDAIKDGLIPLLKKRMSQIQK